MKLSLIVPCYNEELALPFFIEEVKKVINQLEHSDGIAVELVFINDGSKDGTLELLQQYALDDKRIKYISFSRNFGKEAAMYAGLSHVHGDYVAIMDADMQDPPSLLPEMISILKTGDYDSVATRRVTRKGEPPIRSWFAHRFYSIINSISDADVVDGARDFRLMKRDMVDAIVSMKEYNRFSKGIFGWVGFRTYWLPYENIERVAGETKWNFWKLLKYAIDGIINFSDVPLKAASWLGIGFTSISSIALLFIILRRLLLGNPVEGWASIIWTVVFVGGIQLFSVGVMGQYIAKTYAEVRQRPHFIINETNLHE